VGGEFTVLATTNRNYIARLNQNAGSTLRLIRRRGGQSIYAVALQSDGKVLIGGDFSTFNGVPRNASRG